MDAEDIYKIPASTLRMAIHTGMLPAQQGEEDFNLEPCDVEEAIAERMFVHREGRVFTIKIYRQLKCVEQHTKEFSTTAAADQFESMLSDEHKNEKLFNP